MFSIVVDGFVLCFRSSDGSGFGEKGSDGSLPVGFICKVNTAAVFDELRNALGDPRVWTLDVTLHREENVPRVDPDGNKRYHAFVFGSEKSIVGGHKGDRSVV